MSSQSSIEGGETLSLEGTVGPEASAPAGPPLADWNRYELLELLGKGGMGAVYKARDRRLQRLIAIKFLVGADPNLTMRFLREARAQARIDHPNVCRVHEVGEIDGRAYIVLQLVEGEQLHKAAAHMSLDEKVAVMRDVAEAIHEAHRLGIVHRDLKPSNIMVQRTEDGRWLPIIMDFGLAREITAEEGITESGALLGTPSYMPPEQARGDIRAIDRRSDVYSLGATLYQLLTGAAPFPGTSLATILTHVIHDDPAAPSSLAPGLPTDLETVALKCLAKEPTQRYPSARALAEDLARYLNGEPILGRRLSLWQRARMRARRHRALVILGACSLAIILVVAALGIRTWLLAGERARLAERLGREATEIEGALREAYQWPLHDTRPDRERVRGRMRAIAATDHDLGDLGDAIVHDALGRGHLALHEWREAADQLAAAAAAGLHSPGLHAARGRALGELYRSALAEALEEVPGQAAPPSTAREPRVPTRREQELARLRRELAQRYLAPARAELEQSRALGGDAALLEAQLALYRGELSAAEQLAREVAARAPGAVEARRVAAEAAQGAAFEASERGDYELARRGLERAAAQYAEASDIARSDDSLYRAAAQAWLQLAELDFIQGRAPGAALEHALGLVEERALRANPDDPSAYTIAAYVLLRRHSAAASEEAGEQAAVLDRAARAAMTAVMLDPENAHAWLALGNAHVFHGIAELARGEGAPWLRRAIDAFDRVLALLPDNLHAINDLGIAHRWLADALARAGQDPRSEYRAALQSYERAAALAPQYVSACGNQAELHVAVAEHDELSGDDPRPALESARRTGERCLSMNPNYFFALEHLARAELTLAHYLAETGGDPTAALASARHYIERDEHVHPGHIASRYYRLFAARVEAAALVRRGADPTASIAAGRAAQAEALQTMPDSALSYVEAARLDLVEAAWQARAGRDPSAALRAGLAHAEKAIELDPRLAEASAAAAEACLQLARSAPSAAAAGPDSIGPGLSFADQALKLNPLYRKAQALRAELSQLRAP